MTALSLHRSPSQAASFRRKGTLLLLLLLLLPAMLLAQKDSLAVAHARWKTDTIHKGLILKSATLPSLFGASQNITLLELQPNSPLRLAFSYEPRRTATSLQARKHKAVAAINGSFFDMAHHNPICYLRIGGKNLGENTPVADTVNRKYYQYGTLVLHQGHPRILRTEASRHWEEQLKYQDIMTAGPLLIYRGEKQPMRQDRTFVTDRHNRTALALKADGTVLLLTVDGRTKQSAGLSLDELISLLAWLGATDALNLDGGGSTTLWVRNRVVNYPTDNGRYDHQGERPVSNCILIIEQ